MFGFFKNNKNDCPVPEDTDENDRRTGASRGPDAERAGEMLASSEKNSVATSKALLLIIDCGYIFPGIGE